LEFEVGFENKNYCKMDQLLSAYDSSSDDEDNKETNIIMSKYQPDNETALSETKNFPFTGN